MSKVKRSIDIYSISIVWYWKKRLKVTLDIVMKGFVAFFKYAFN